MCDIVTSRILAGPVKINEHKQDEYEDIEKQLAIFHILNGTLAKARVIIFYKKVSWSYRGFVGDGEWSFRGRLCGIPRANRDFQLISREKRGRLGML